MVIYGISLIPCQALDMWAVCSLVPVCLGGHPGVSAEMLGLVSGLWGGVSALCTTLTPPQCCVIRPREELLK